jgi:transketolase N-terminal domain/subunit
MSKITKREEFMPRDNNERGEKKELNYISEDGELNVPVMFEAVMVKYMGRVLDLIRISDISERNLTQLQRTIKDDCYDKIKFAKAILEKHGIDETK